MNVRAPVLGAAVFAALVVGFPPAASAELPSRADFAVDVQGGPDGVAQAPQVAPDPSACTIPQGQRPPFSVSCAFPYAFRRSGQVLSGKVTWLSKAQQGTFQMTCDWDMSINSSAVVDVDAAGKVSASPRIGFSGSGTQPCSFTIAFGASSLTGTIAGKVSLGLVGGDTSPPATNGFFRGDFQVTVVGGTGDFQGANGSGSFTEEEQFDFAGKVPSLGSITSMIPSTGGPPAGAPPGSTGPPAGVPPGVTGPPAGAPPGAGGPPGTTTAPAAMLLTPVARLLLGRSAQTGSTMTLTLHKGVPAAKIVMPAMLARTSPYALHVATVPRATCTASATKGAQTVALGKASDTNKDGSLVFQGKLATKLGQGAWQITVSCTAGATKITGVARAKIG